MTNPLDFPSITSDVYIHRPKTTTIRTIQRHIYLKIDLTDFDVFPPQCCDRAIQPKYVTGAGISIKHDNGTKHPPLQPSHTHTRSNLIGRCYPKSNIVFRPCLVYVSDRTHSFARDSQCGAMREIH